MADLQIHNITKSYGSHLVLRGISFHVAEGEILALLGPSGCGKSTLLSVIAGLEPPDSGDVLWDNRSLQGTPPHRRNFGLMFQDYLLFPHKNVMENVAFGLKMQKWPRERVVQRVNEVLRLVGLMNYSQRDVSTLSGGEQQRVALARSLAPNPRLLMLDEPLGSLDRTLRERLLGELRDILRKTNQTAIYVTHDQEEAFSLADRIVLINEGQVVQIGTPTEIYHNPRTEFVARFLGFRNIFKGECRDGVLHTPLGEFPLPASAPPTRSGRQVMVLIRPDRMSLHQRGRFHLQGGVRQCTFRGSLCLIDFEVKGLHLRLEFPSSIPLPRPGETLTVNFDPDEAVQVLQP